jgi:hypothetical protein
MWARTGFWGVREGFLWWFGGLGDACRGGLGDGLVGRRCVEVGVLRVRGCGGGEPGDGSLVRSFVGVFRRVWGCGVYCYSLRVGGGC